ncbi:hypothetical protein F5X68DRAFT_228935 [Plectosphaerella plurivora]|uniref:Uncharacterized protein n=1 Tax=Plectosphaerella plurivora TaxID=936078 RepID=A0A9P8VI42_9PEZI|nr:hypothetical protein F5X68DRAFT_228935 [Plectosphaerella plurivora]
MYPLHEDLDRTTGYAVLDEWENYTVSWTGARAGEHVKVRWGLGMPTGQFELHSYYPRVSWGKNTTEDHIVFRPVDVFAEIIERNHTNLTIYEIKGLASEMTNLITVGQERRPGEERGSEDTSSQFSVQGGWATSTMVSYAENKRREERRRWTLGVGIGVGLGVPILMALTGLVTWTVARNKMGRPVRKGSS